MTKGLAAHNSSARRSGRRHDHIITPGYDKSGLPVPAGFTIATHVCNIYFKNNNQVPEDIQKEIDKSIVKLEKLKSNRGYVLIAIFIIAAILTPPDALSQCVMAVPMYLLYEGGVLMAQIMQRMQRSAAERDAAKVGSARPRRAPSRQAHPVCRSCRAHPERLA